MYGYTLFPDELSQDVQDIEKEKIRFAAPNRFKIKKKKTDIFSYLLIADFVLVFLAFATLSIEWPDKQTKVIIKQYIYIYCVCVCVPK